MSHPSHQLAVFQLATKLIRVGIQVSFLGPRIGMDKVNLENVVKNNGFEFIVLPILGDQDWEEHSEELAGYNFINNLIDSKLYVDFFANKLPDLVILDIFYMPLCIILRQLSVKFVLASTILLSDKGPKTLPLDCPFIHDTEDNTSKVWESLVIQKENEFGEYIALLREIAVLNKFDFDSYFYWEKSIVPFGFKFPEVIFWDKEFDFPREERELKDKYYLGNQVYIDAVQINGPSIESFRQDIFYVSFGSKESTLNDHKDEFIKKILILASRLPEYCFICNVSKKYLSKYNKEEHSNVVLMNYCPQIEILKKAKLMLTHAGGSVKECLRFAVPMICYPIDNDQFGVANRVVFHGVGKKGDFLNDSVDQIYSDIIEIIGSRTIKQNLLIWQQRAIDDELKMNDVELILKLIND